MATYVYEDGTGWTPLTASQLPASGVAAGTYGDATHVGRFTVDTHGIITAASDVAITGGGGGGTVEVTDGTHTVAAATEVDFTSGATVTDAGGGVAQVAITGGGGGGTELDYVTQANDLNVTANSAATAQAFIPGNAVTYDGSTRIKLEFWSAGIFASANACIIELFRGATDLGRLSQSAFPAPAGPFYAVYFETPAAGSHAYTVGAWRSNSGASATVIGTTGGVFLPAWYRITTA